MKDIRFDIHLNVGKVYRTEKPGSVEMFYTGKEIADFVNYYGITHGVCIYDKYENLKELMDNTDAKIYGVQWIVDKDQTLDVGKEGWYGIKLHSHRGYRDASKYCWKSKGKKGDRGSLSYGLHYSDKYVKDILETLPKNSLVYMHTQGWPSPDNRARPEHLFMLATEFNNLKFIMGHSGMYGGIQSALPGLKEIPSYRPKGFNVHQRSIRTWGDCVVRFNTSVIYSNLIHNLFLDSSCYTPDKALAYMSCDRWCIGSDYPFGKNKPRNSEGNVEDSHYTREDFEKAYAWNFNKQYDKFSKVLGEERVQQGFNNAHDYIETPIEVLVQIQYERLNKIKSYIKSNT